MTLLDIEVVRRGALRRDPFAWAALRGVLTGDAAAALSRTFPREGFADVSSAASSKAYRMAVRNLVKAGAPADLTGVDAIWRELVGELLSPAYREAVADLVALPLAKLHIEVSLWHYGQRCFLAPHTDKPSKVVTHLFYMTPDWDPAFGGHLLVLRDAHPESVAARVAPTLGTSVILPRSAASWHAVEEVTAHRAPPRTSVQVVFSQ